MDHSGRLRRLQAVLPEHKLDWFLVTHLPNIRYLSGFTGSAGILLINDHSATLFTDGRYRTQAREEVSSAKIVIARKSPLLAAAELHKTLYRLAHSLEWELPIETVARWVSDTRELFEQV